LGHALFADHFASKDFNLAWPSSKIAGAAIDGHNGDRPTGLQNVQVMA
jgi:hypothetical protein